MDSYQRHNHGAPPHRGLLQRPETHGAVDRGGEEAVVHRAHAQRGDARFVAREEAEVGVVEERQVADLVRDLPARGVVGRGLARVEDGELVVLFRFCFWGGRVGCSGLVSMQRVVCVMAYTGVKET